MSNHIDFIFYSYLFFCFSALDKIIVQGYKALQLQYFFTAGHDEVKAWTIQVSTICNAKRIAHIKL